MSAVYDRHEYIKDLTGAGLNEPQAETIAKGAVRVQESALATKEDIAELKMDMAKLEMRLIKWGVSLAIGIVFSQTALTVALIKLLP